MTTSDEIEMAPERESAADDTTRRNAPVLILLGFMGALFLAAAFISLDGKTYSGGVVSESAVTHVAQPARPPSTSHT